MINVDATGGGRDLKYMEKRIVIKMICCMHEEEIEEIPRVTLGETSHSDNTM